MNGVLFQFREKSVTAVSTDSFRLVKATLRSEKSDYPHELDIIIPARTIDLLKKLDDDAVLSTIESHGKKTHVRIDSGNIVIIARLIDERFPPYETVIPQNNHIKAVVKKNDVLGSIRRVAILSNKISYQIRLKLEPDLMTILGEDEDVGDRAVETMPCLYSGATFEIGFNYNYLEQAVQNIESASGEEEVLFTFSESNKPALVKPNIESDDLLMLIMPVRL
jgi:DNA polymerase-3 subunit beta